MDDVERAIKNLKDLGRSLDIITLKGNEKMIQSVPCELSQVATRPLHAGFFSLHRASKPL